MADIVWAPQPGPQHALVECPLPLIFFGGARGGGKTDGVLGKWAIKEQAYGPRFNAIMFRRTTTSSDDAIDRSKEIYGSLGGRFVSSPQPTWRMPNGGKVSFRYLNTVEDAAEWQGRNVSDVWVEEAGQYPLPAPIDRLFGVLRSAGGVPVQMILTGNPGGPGQGWMRERFGLAPFPSKPTIRRVAINEGSINAAVIPSRITDNKILLETDPDYVERLRMVGSGQLVKAWLDGDWSAVDGAFFDEWSGRNILPPFSLPSHWLRFRSMDWGYAAPFSIGWWAVASDDYHDIPRGALVRYREWYGAVKPNVGVRMTAEEVAAGILEREKGETIAYGVIDPSAGREDGGPSILDRLRRSNVLFRPADNTRVGQRGAMSGWDAMRSRIKGQGGRPMLFVFETCRDFIRTVPILQHDPIRAEDLDTEGEDHCFVADTLVTTAKGLYSIADLVGKTGRVLSHDGRFHRFRSARLVKRDQPIVRLVFNDGSAVECTPDHKFLTATGWMDAKDMVGAPILSLSALRSKSLAVCASTVAGRASRPIAIPKSGHARAIVGQSPAVAHELVCVEVKDAGRADVYCLTVPSTGNFALANGALVSNCADETRYACMSRPWIVTEPARPPKSMNDYRARPASTTDMVI